MVGRSSVWEAENVVRVLIPLDPTLEAHKGPGVALEQGHSPISGPSMPSNCSFHLGFRNRSVNNSCSYQLQGEFTIPVGFLKADPHLVKTPCI